MKPITLHHTSGLVGVDEVGRGPLAGPVVAAAVILPNGISLPGVNDSKLLSPAERELLFTAIKNSALAVGVGASSARLIDRIGILPATFRAMALALRRISTPFDGILVDGKMPIPSRILEHYGVNPHLPCQPLVKGDSRELSIAAASIIAKVTRDFLMQRLDRLYPEWGFATNNGYGTSHHLRLLVNHPPTPHHRLSFAPIRSPQLRLDDAQS